MAFIFAFFAALVVIFHCDEFHVVLLLARLGCSPTYHILFRSTLDFMCSGFLKDCEPSFGEEFQPDPL